MSDQPSGLPRTVLHLGTALGLAAAIFATPILYGWGKAAIWRYLLASFGPEYAPWLMWTTGAIEAFVVYTVCKTLVVFGLTWLLAALAARGLTNS